MHPSALNFGKLFFETYCQNMSGKTVVDLGSQNVNGCLKDVCPKNLNYVGVDFVAGKNVDVILTDPYKLPFNDNSVDVLVSSSVFEHSELFWVLFLEIIRILKPGGLFYLNVPSNGHFHRYPVDCWRFYPDSGQALVTWAKRSGYQTTLLESFIGKRTENYPWNDFVAVFCKSSEDEAKNFKSAMVDKTTDFFNGCKLGQEPFLNESMFTEDSLIIAEQEKLKFKNRLKRVRRSVYKFIGIKSKNGKN